MGFYTEKRDQLIDKIKVLEKRIASDTAKKSLEEKLKEVTRLAMAEEYNCKPRELDEIISSEHLLLQKLRASGMSDAELLELCGVKTSDSTDSNVAADSNTDSDEIRFYDDPDRDLSLASSGFPRSRARSWQPSQQNH